MWLSVRSGASASVYVCVCLCVCAYVSVYLLPVHLPSHRKPEMVTPGRAAPVQLEKLRRQLQGQIGALQAELAAEVEARRADRAAPVLASATDVMEAEARGAEEAARLRAALEVSGPVWIYLACDPLR